MKRVPDLADGAVPVVGQRVDEDGDAAGAVALVRHFVVGDAFFFAGAAPDGPLDVVGGHVVLLGLGDDRAQARVHVGIAAAVAGRDRQFLDEAREDLAALGVGRALLVLDGVPLGMAGHDSLSFENRSRTHDPSTRTCRVRRAGNGTRGLGQMTRASHADVHGSYP